jgi:hypothetical protein
MNVGQYCRELETYLCRKNEGHLIRIVGPVFDQVSAWAQQGVPLTIAFRGVDRYCERYYAKGPRRRPVRIEFCEADILDLFDDWRRAVGVAGSSAGTEKRATLPAHLDRAIAKLTERRAGEHTERFARALEGAVRELNAMKPSAKTVRGEERVRLIDRLAALDRELLRAADEELAAAERARLRQQAEAELDPFAARMPADAMARARDAAFDRLLRDAAGLPIVAFE